LRWIFAPAASSNQNSVDIVDYWFLGNPQYPQATRPPAIVDWFTLSTRQAWPTRPAAPKK
jgi:hypothetical protein